VIPLSSVSHPSGCRPIVDKRLVIEKKFTRIISFVSMLSAYKISEMQCKGNIFKFGVE